MTAELARDLTEPEARALTDEIRLAAERVWALLLAAHERRAWAALGYQTWEVYVRAEFDMGRQYAYRLLDQGRIIREIETAAGVSPMGDIGLSEREARDLKPHLALVVDRVREQVADLPPERAAEVVREVVAEVRQEVQRNRQDRQALDELAAELNLPEVDEDAENDRIALTHELYRALHGLAGLPPAAEVAALIPTYQQYRLADLQTALDWLTGFAQAWEARS